MAILGVAVLAWEISAHIFVLPAANAGECVDQGSKISDVFVRAACFRLCVISHSKHCFPLLDIEYAIWIIFCKMIGCKFDIILVERVHGGLVGYDRHSGLYRNLNFDDLIDALRRVAVEVAGQ